MATATSTSVLLDAIREMDAPEDLIPHIREEMSRRVTAKDPDIWIKIKGQESVKRAILVAAAQGHSILILGQAGTSKGMLCEAARQVGVRTGSLEAPPGLATPRVKTAFVKKAEKEFPKFDIHVESWPVTPRTLMSPQHGTTLADIQRHLAQCQLPPACKAEQLTGLPKDLLVQAMRELNLKPALVEKVMDIARSIAGLDGSAAIETQHLAEALQYRLDRNLP